jgi:translation initiation factor 5A
MLKLASILL